MFFNSSGKYKAYALVTAPKFVVDRILPLNGIIFNNRNLSIEINKTTTPYDRAAMQRGSSRQSHFPTSGNKNAKGEPRPIPNAASRQEESDSSINRIEDEPDGTNPEEAGGRFDTTQNNKSMAQVLGEQENRRLLEDRNRCQLLIDIRSNDEGSPFPSASMVYQVLTEQLGLFKDPSNGVKAICTPNPNNRWRWLVLFASENLTTKFQGKTITLTFTHKNDKTEYTYTFTTRGGKKRESNNLMITVQSSPLIPDQELGSYLTPYGDTVHITQKKHGFAKHIDSGLQLIFIKLHKDVNTRDIPGSLRTSDGVWRKLFFRGKLYTCGGCGNKHTFTEGCATSQHDEQENCQTSQDKEQPILKSNNITSQTRDSTNTQ